MSTSHHRQSATSSVLLSQQTHAELLRCNERSSKRSGYTNIHGMNEYNKKGDTVGVCYTSSGWKEYKVTFGVSFRLELNPLQVAVRNEHKKRHHHTRQRLCWLQLCETIAQDTDSQCYWLCVQFHLSWYSTQTYFSCIFDALPIVFSAPDAETIIQMGMKSTDLCFDFADGQTAVAFVPLFERTLIWLWWTLWSIFKHRRQRKTFLRYWRSIWKCGNGSDGKEFYLLIEKDGVEYTICKTLPL